MKKRLISLLLTLVMVCGLLPRTAASGMSTGGAFRTADTVAFEEDTEYYLDEAGRVCMRIGEQQSLLTERTAELLMVWQDGLYMVSGRELHRRPLPDGEISLCFTAEAAIEAFAANDDGFFLLCGGQIIRLDRAYEWVAAIPTETDVTALWLADDDRLCYMVDDQFIFTRSLHDSSVTREENHASSLEKETGKRSMKLSQLRRKFPDGKYWNHANNPGAENWKNNQNGWTDIPCPRHGVVGTYLQTCNGFQPGNVQYSWQCWGYADKCGYDVTGGSPADDEKGWYTTYSVSYLNRLKAGDILRYRTSQAHSIYVTAVSGNTVTFTDCNYFGSCQIRWDVTISLSTLWDRFIFCEVAPSEAVNDMNQDPKGELTSAEGDVGKVHLTGSCSDGDDPDAELEVLVCVNGPMDDDAAELHEGYQTKEHRFDLTVPVEQVGKTMVYVYAKNVMGGKDALIGTAEVELPGAELTVTLDARGGAVDETSRTVTLYGTYGELPLPVRTNYIFEGWFTKDGTPITADTKVTTAADHVLYAHWTHICADGHSYQYRVTAYPALAEEGMLTGRCSRCGRKDEHLLPELNEADYDVRIVREPTCVRQGLADYVWNEKSYGSFYFETVIPRIDHAYELQTVEATCTEQGCTTYTCTVCGDSFTADYRSALGHAFDENGACSRCGLQQQSNDTHSNRICQTSTPTCTEQGFTITLCDDCGFVLEQEYVPALGHDWDAGQVTAEPTIIAAGERTFRCTRCGESRAELIDELPYPFRDVRERAYCRLPVGWAAMTGITNGVSAHRFAPDSSCTRGQIVTFLWRAMGSPEPNGIENPFTDVMDDSSCYQAVLWAVEQGITNGVNATTFGVNRPCTRGQAVTFLHRAAGSGSSGLELGYTDVAANSYCYAPVCWAVEHGITNGTGELSFSPNSVCTRGQIVTFLWRAEELLQ